MQVKLQEMEAFQEWERTKLTKLIRIVEDVETKLGAFLKGYGELKRLMEGVREIPVSRKRRFDSILNDAQKLFTGRAVAEAQIESFLQGPGGFLLIEALPGYGKTTLLANLVEWKRDAIHYHFFNRRLYPTSEQSFAENLAQQLLTHHAVGGQMPQGLGVQQVLCIDLLQRWECRGGQWWSSSMVWLRQTFRWHRTSSGPCRACT